MQTNHFRSLKIHGVFLIVALVVQYILGMYINLFVAFPDNLNPNQLWEFAWSQKAVASHIILAMLILLGAIVVLIRSIWFRNKTWIIVSIVGLCGVLAAGMSGSEFITSQTDAYSYAMSVCFLIAIGSYSWGLFVSQQHRLPS